MHFLNQMCFSQKDLYKRFPDRIPRRWNAEKRERWGKTRKEMCEKIFADTFFEILLDIIENNVTFVLPLRWGEYAEISMDTIEGDDFIKMYKKGSFEDIDFVLSNFTGHRLKYTYKKGKNTRWKHIYISYNLRDILSKHTNEGKVYY